MSNFLLLNYNNYFNRIEKIENSIDAYQDAATNYKHIININFNPKDNIQSDHVINWNLEWNPDYLVVYDEYKEIKSRWFIVNSEFLSGGLCRIYLKHDTVADYYNEIINAHTYIQKATLDDNDPAIFNNEGDKFNQIKVSQEEIYDYTGCPWIVGYVPKDTNLYKQEGQTKTPLSVKIDLTNTPVSEELTQEQFEAKWWYQYTVSARFRRSYQQAEINVNFQHIDAKYQYRCNLLTDYQPEPFVIPNSSSVAFKTTSPITDVYVIDKSSMTHIKENLVVTDNNLDEFLALNNKIISIDGVKKKIKVKKITWKSNYTVATTAPLYDEMINILTADLDDTTLLKQSGSMTYTLKIEGYRLELHNLINDTFYLDIQEKEDRLSTVDAPYDIFCIPYDDIDLYWDETHKLTTNKDVSLSIAQTISLTIGQGNVYDIQVLPFCPIQNPTLIRDDILDCSKLSTINIYSKNSLGHSIVQNKLIWVPESSINFYIDKKIEIEEPKIENSCDLWRLNAGNWSAAFDFSVAKNKGLNGFEVNQTIKPYQSYIHVAPIFNADSLYGGDYNDARGIIYAGDMSAPQMSSAWADYQLSNKNYENQFNREIQNMDTQYTIRESQKITNTILSDIGNANKVFTSGDMKGQKHGAAHWTTYAQQGVDLMADTASHLEARDYKKDMFAMQLDNIQALPNTITKVGALNANNLVVPVLEKYTCTDTERETFRQKLYFMGMTVNRVDIIKNYLKDDYTFISGDIIRLEGIDNDYHIINDIRRELREGVFIKWESLS